jgi:hypothetical protein
MSADLPNPDYAHNLRIIGHCDQGGRPDGVQTMVHRGYAYYAASGKLARKLPLATLSHRNVSANEQVDHPTGS